MIIVPIVGPHAVPGNSDRNVSPEPYRSDDCRSSTEPLWSSSIVAGVIARESLGVENGREKVASEYSASTDDVHGCNGAGEPSSTNRRQPVDELGLDCASIMLDPGRAIRQLGCVGRRAAEATVWRWVDCLTARR